MPITFSTLITQLDTRLNTDGLEARRLFHGRGGTIPGLEHLTIDWYPPLLHLVCYQPIDGSLPKKLAEWLVHRLSPAPLGIILQQRHIQGSPQQLVWGNMPKEHFAHEKGLRYRLHFDRGQNIGFFPDMARGRQLVRTTSSGQNVLNLFAYTCSLSVAALAGGAGSVTNLDMSRNSLEWGRDNHILNGIDPRQFGFLAHDLFKSFSKLRRLGPFDLVIADPPDTQGNSFRPERDWPRLLRHLPDLLRPGGELLACMAVPRLGRSFLESRVAKYAPGCQLVAADTAGRDFPETEPDKGLHLLRYRYAPGKD